MSDCVKQKPNTEYIFPVKKAGIHFNFFLEDNYFGCLSTSLKLKRTAIQHIVSTIYLSGVGEVMQCRCRIARKMTPCHWICCRVQLSQNYPHTLQVHGHLEAHAHTIAMHAQ